MSTEIPARCKSYGYPGMHQGQSLRLYTERECESIGGKYKGSGECVNSPSDGLGSWTWDCRGLNDLPGGGILDDFPGQIVSLIPEGISTYTIVVNATAILAVGGLLYWRMRARS